MHYCPKLSIIMSSLRVSCRPSAPIFSVRNQASSRLPAALAPSVSPFSGRPTAPCKKATTEVIAFFEEYYEKLSLLPYQNFKIVARTLFAHVKRSSRPSAPSSMASLTRSGYPVAILRSLPARISLYCSDRHHQSVMTSPS